MSGHRISIADLSNKRFWQIAILTAAGTLGAGSQADAALYYWEDFDPGYYRSEPMVQPRRQEIRGPSAKKDAASQKKTGAKPQGPLIIAVSIQRQKVRIYDGNGLFAESPVSTGMPGHSTPMGVFSIIQKHKFHQSNIYSGAPMPYMQRITWSGVAMHAGVLPGYPASHGCIRMPMAFAVKMWNWTRLGARVIVTPGELTPANFSHPLLVTQKLAPPIALEEPKVDAPLGVKSDKGADAGAAAKTTTEASLDSRSTVASAKSPGAVPLRAQTHAADASVAVLTGNPAAAIADASPAAAAADNSAHEPAPDADASMSAPDLKKDPARPPGIAKPEPPKRTGQVSVLISGKASKIYVRQNFAPLFDAPVTIAPSDRPLGTHVFTARADQNDANVLHWSVVSLPAAARNAARSENDDPPTRRRMAGAPAETRLLPVPDSPTEALDRITIPPDVMARVAEALATGASIIVSDQGVNQGETGEGTDFIVSLR